MKSIFTFIFIVFLSLSLAAKIRLPNNIGTNMVLQQQAEIEIWGWGAPAEKVYITTSWNHKTDSTITTGNAKWKIKITTPKAGGPYAFKFKGTNQIDLDNVMIGEVWFCSGQSNMQWGSNEGIKQMNDALALSQNKNIRIFQVTHSTASFPQDNVEGSWKEAGPETLKGFSAVGYFFAKELYQKLNIPIGIINASWGGTPAEVWAPTSVVEKDQKLMEAAKLQSVTPWWPITPGNAFNAMVYPFTKQPIAGVIWYQGESNTLTYSTYSLLFTNLIQSWRKEWKNEFPFYYVQIAPFAYENKNIGNLLREQQAKVLAVPKTGMVVISDLVDDINDIHPQNKIDVSKRLANYALVESYHQPIESYKSPMFRQMEVEKGKAILYFDYMKDGFKLNKGKVPTQFYIAGGDEIFFPAIVRIKENSLIVYHPKVKIPKAVRFSFSNTGISNILSKEGLPLAPFRTDDWVVDTSKLK